MDLVSIEIRYFLKSEDQNIKKFCISLLKEKTINFKVLRCFGKKWYLNS